jgi:hypothetical protein
VTAKPFGRCVRYFQFSGLATRLGMLDNAEGLARSYLGKVDGRNEGEICLGVVGLVPQEGKQYPTSAGLFDRLL